MIGILKFDVWSLEILERTILFQKDNIRWIYGDEKITFSMKIGREIDMERKFESD